MRPDHQGKQPPGVDGIAKLTPPEWLALSEPLPREGQASPVRRVDRPKPGTTEQRPLGMPPMADRVKQALVKHMLEPAWEAQSDPKH